MGLSKLTPLYFFIFVLLSGPVALAGDDIEAAYEGMVRVSEGMYQLKGRLGLTETWNEKSGKFDYQHRIFVGAKGSTKTIHLKFHGQAEWITNKGLEMTDRVLSTGTMYGAFATIIGQISGTAGDGTTLEFQAKQIVSIIYGPIIDDDLSIEE